MLQMTAPYRTTAALSFSLKKCNNGLLKEFIDYLTMSTLVRSKLPSSPNRLQAPDLFIYTQYCHLLFCSPPWRSQDVAL